MLISKKSIIELLLLEILAYVPIILVLGNILPPVGFLKLHWMYIGVIFLLTLLLLAMNKRSIDLLVLLFLFGSVNILVSVKFSISEFIDFVAGPLLLIAVVNILISGKISDRILNRFRIKALISLSVPVLVCFLQFLKILPLEFLNAKYVNVTEYGSEIFERVNGFLFHGIELAIIIYLFFINSSLFTKGVKVYVLFIIMIYFEFITLIKTGIITGILITLYYAYFIDTRFRSAKSILVGVFIFIGFSYIFILIPDLESSRLQFDIENFEFEDQLFTGRGFIWNTYLRGVRDFDFFQVLFGTGFGSSSTIFEQNVTEISSWTPGPHNQLLDLFVNGGLFAIWFVFFIIYKQYVKLTKSIFINRKLFVIYYLGVIAVPLLVMGITAPIMGMFVYWYGLSLIIVSFKVKLAFI